MKHISMEQENHLSKINRLLSMYQVLDVKQLEKAFPDLDGMKLRMLLKRLEKNGRLAFDKENSMVMYSKECGRNQAVIAAFWVLLDFYSDITYHTVSEYPVALTFYTDKDGYDVVYVPEDKEIMINHALAGLGEESPHRLVIVEKPEQMAQLHFPGIAAFCLVLPDGKVQYYRKQGVTES